nr:hypothetical protein [Tanacetum cinerariifolium]
IFHSLYTFSHKMIISMFELPRPPDHALCIFYKIQKLESEYWNLKVKGIDLLNYHHRFQELALMCDRMFPEESAKVERKPYRGTKPLCPKCNYHHDGPCASKYTNCKKIGHLARDCKGRPAAANNNNNQNNNNNNNNQKAQGATARGNRAGNRNVVARAYVVGTARTNPNSNVVTCTFLLNKRYASVLFDTGADRSFVSTVFSSLIDIIPTILDHGYDVN